MKTVTLDVNKDCIKNMIKKPGRPLKKKRGRPKSMTFPELPKPPQLRHSLGCSVNGCTSTDKWMYTLPEADDLRERWLEFLSRPNWIADHRTRVCEVHFEQQMWKKTRDGQQTLRADAFPTIYAPEYGDEASEILNFVDMDNFEEPEVSIKSELLEPDIMNPPEPPGDVKCQFCEKNFSSKGTCTRHIKNVHKLNLNGGPILDRPREIFTCVFCDKNFAAKQNLEHHINVVHLLNLKKYKCSKCKFETFHRSNLKRHILKTHKNVQEISEICSAQYFKCSECPAKFKEERNLKYHQRKSHKLGVAISTRRKCPMCPYVSVQKSKLEIYYHFESIHDIPIKKKHYNFETVEEFHSWKNEIEKVTTTSYVKTKSTDTVTYYQCHRCGYHRSKGHLKRRMKMSGSCKINAFCPASITMKVNNNKVQVSFVSTHVGHKNDLKYLRLTNEEKRSIALQMASKKPHEEILKSIRGSIYNLDVHRLSNKKDIVNIENGLNLHDESVKHPFDPISITSWVKDFSNSDNLALIVYKPQGIEDPEFPDLKADDFLLLFMTEAQKNMLQKYGHDTICINGTHALNSYDFQLYTLLVLDNTREGFPAAFLFTNRGDECIISKFYGAIKNVTGCITPKVFISDMEKTFFSAWIKHMGVPEHNIFCAQNNMCKHIHTVAKSEIKEGSDTNKQTDSSDDSGQQIIDCELEHGEDQEQEKILSQISQKVDEKLTLENFKLNLIKKFNTLMSHITSTEQATFVGNEINKIITTLDAMNMSAASRSTLNDVSEEPEFGLSSILTQRKKKSPANTRKQKYLINIKRNPAKYALYLERERFRHQIRRKSLQTWPQSVEDDGLQNEDIDMHEVMVRFQAEESVSQIPSIRVEPLFPIEEESIVPDLVVPSSNNVEEMENLESRNLEDTLVAPSKNNVEKEENLDVSPNDLPSHLIEEKGYRCPLCKKHLARKGSLIYHLEKTHPSDETAQKLVADLKTRFKFWKRENILKEWHELFPELASETSSVPLTLALTSNNSSVVTNVIPVTSSLGEVSLEPLKKDRLLKNYILWKEQLEYKTKPDLPKTPLKSESNPQSYEIISDQSQPQLETDVTQQLLELNSIIYDPMEANKDNLKIEAKDASSYMFCASLRCVPVEKRLVVKRKLMEMVNAVVTQKLDPERIIVAYTP